MNTANVSRRTVLKGAGAAGLGTTLAPGVAAADDTRKTPRRPNIVIVYCDDLGYGDLSSYGSPLVRTPVLDGMAERGVRFTDFYAGAPTCTPSRAALLTGCYAPRINLSQVLFPGDENGIAQKETTLAEYLKSAGYATAMFGKWHLGDPRADTTYHPLDHGFDRYFGLPYSNDMSPLPLYDDREVIEEPPEQSSLTRRYSEQTVAFIREHADEPFFVYLAHTQPHEPLAAEFADKSAGGEHGDSVEEIDHYVGVILDELDAQGIRDNTCVVFTSDNGPWFVGSPGDLYGRKAETYEGGQRVPMILEWPDATPTGLTYTEPAALVDLLPTFIAAAGVELDPSRPIDGKNILPAITRGHRVDRGDIYYYDDQAPAGHCNAVRSGTWKLHVRRVSGPYFTSRGAETFEELPQLFDFRHDEEETYDLSEHHPDLTRRLTARLEAFDADLRADHAARYGNGD